jgi:alkylation response protein AidB-like acyl-CoA dehydrogenase
MPFFQTPPALPNQYDDDRVLRGYLRRRLPPSVLKRWSEELRFMGELAAGELFALQLADRDNEPQLVQWDSWGRRIDEVRLTPLWQHVAPIAAEKGLVAIPYERSDGAFSRLLQFALVYLFEPSTDTYTCPLAMSDGAAKTLLASENRPLIERAVARLIHRNFAQSWTSGQWMTERTGGSDVGRSETVARAVDGQYRLYGTKWFTSAVTAQMALALARPEGNEPGAKGLALFYVETRGVDGGLQGITVNRLKDKLGTRKLPTAELSLDGCAAVPVAGLNHGVRTVTPMLAVTRTWNAVCSVAAMRRAVALCRDYAGRREAFGAPLAEAPLHQELLADLQAETEGAFHLAFRLAELLGLDEVGEATDAERALLRMLTPIAKLMLGKQAVAVTSEAIEAFGGAGYVEDTGLPRLLRDAQVLPIWEGTTNVLALDSLRALRDPATWPALLAELDRLRGETTRQDLADATRASRDCLDQLADWWRTATGVPAQAEAGARRFALAIGRALEVSLLASQAQWSIDNERDGRAAAAVLRLRRRADDLPGAWLNGTRELALDLAE